MSPVERLNAAIEKLETILDETGRHGWDVQTAEGSPYYSGNPRIWRRDTVGGYAPVPFSPDERVPVEVIATMDWRTPDYATAIVTLHRTIEAQLEILHGALEAAEGRRDWPQFSGDGRDLALADAILGDI